MKLRVDKYPMIYEKDYDDCTVKRGQCLNVTMDVDAAKFGSIAEPVTFDYGINYALESVGIDGDGRIMQERNGDSVHYNYDFYLKDHLGSTRMVINDEQHVTERVNYQAYGSIEPLDSTSSPLPARDKFTGKENDIQGADFARFEYDIEVSDFDWSRRPGAVGGLHVWYKDNVSGNGYRKIYFIRLDSLSRTAIFTGSESFISSTKITQMVLMAGHISYSIYNSATVDSFTVNPGTTRRVQLRATSYVLYSNADSSFYTINTPEDNTTYFSGTKLFYFGARYYDPELGIWMSVDPAEEYWNSYLYCGADPINYYDPDGLWTFGLGLVFGYDKEHGFHVGFGAAADFKEETGFGFGANLYSAYNADGSWTHTASVNASADYYGLEGHIGAGYTYNTHTGSTLSGYIGGSYQSYGGVELGGSLYWNNDGDFRGGTAYAEGFVGPTYAHIAGGYEWGSGQMEGRGWYGEAVTPIAQGGYSQAQGWYYGAQVNQTAFEYNSASGQWGYVGPQTRSDFAIAAPLLIPALDGIIYVGSAILTGIAGHIALKKAEEASREVKQVGKRVYLPSKKRAEDAARTAGGGKKPIQHKDSGHGPHYHPNVPKGSPKEHDHYYYP